jgi:hypothetical protein
MRLEPPSVPFVGRVPGVVVVITSLPCRAVVNVNVNGACVPYACRREARSRSRSR